MSFLGRLRVVGVVLLASLASAPFPAHAGDPVPDRAAVEKEVRADLDAAYAAFQAKETAWEPPYEGEVGRLCSPDRDQRVAGGLYLGILVRMTDADARAGRTPPRQGWSIGGPQDVGDELRSNVASALARAPLDPAAVEALDAALWLADEDRLDSLRVDGARAVVRVRHPDADAALVRWVTTPHATRDVLVVALNAVQERKLVAAAPGVRALCAHYRTEIADAARAAAEALGLSDVPSFDPKAPLPAAVLARLEQLASCVPESIPADARWARLTFPTPVSFDFDDRRGSREVTCWILSRSGSSMRLLDLLGHAFTHPLEDVTVLGESLSESARALIALRQAAFEPLDEAKSRAFIDLVGMQSFVGHQGAWTGSLPEVLLAAWCARAGEGDAARDLILPLLRAHDDEAALFDMAFQQLASRVDRDMLDAFTGRRYEEALRIARHASSPKFDAFWAQDRAKELVEEIPRRIAEDWVTLTLPSPKAWAEMRASMSRDAQVEFLAARLRLIHDVQVNIPGGIDWGAPQYDVPAELLPGWGSPDRDEALERHAAINPFVELSRFNLEARELVPLIRLIERTDHILAYDLPRFMPHFPQRMHRVRWLAATLVEAVLGEDTVSRDLVQGSDAAARTRHIEALIAQAKAAGGLTEADRQEKTLTTGTDDRELQHAYGRLGALDPARAVKILLKRAESEPPERGRWLRLAYAVDAPATQGAAEAFLGDPNEAAAFWAAALLMRNGEGDAKTRGKDAVLEALEAGDPHLRIDVVLDDLLAVRDGRVDALLGRYLTPTRDAGHVPTALVLQRALLLGRQDAFDRLKDGIEGRGTLPLGSYDGDGEAESYDRRHVESPDVLAGYVRRWLGPPPDWTRPRKDDEAAKAKRREEAVALLQTAFAAVKAGTPPKVDREERPIPLGRWAWVSSGWVLRTR